MVGRLLGGIATSILYSAFESWVIYEHHKVWHWGLYLSCIVILYLVAVLYLHICYYVYATIRGVCAEDRKCDICTEVFPTETV